MKSYRRTSLHRDVRGQLGDITAHKWNRRIFEPLGYSIISSEMGSGIITPIITSQRVTSQRMWPFENANNHSGIRTSSGMLEDAVCTTLLSIKGPLTATVAMMCSLTPGQRRCCDVKRWPV